MVSAFWRYWLPAVVAGCCLSGGWTAAGESSPRPDAPRNERPTRPPGDVNRPPGGGNPLAPPPGGDAAEADEDAEELPKVHALARYSVVKRRDGTEVRGVILLQTDRGVLLALEKGQEFVPAADVAGVERIAPAAVEGEPGQRQWQDSDASTVVAFATELREGGYRIAGRMRPSGAAASDEATKRLVEPRFKLAEFQQLMEEMAAARKGQWPQDPKRAEWLRNYMRAIGQEVPAPEREASTPSVRP